MENIAKNVTKIKDVMPEVSTRTENAAKLKSMRDKDRQMVKGVFKYYEVPGGSVGFCFKKYKEDPIETFDLVDGQIYTIPLGVAKHLNSNTWYPIHGHTVDENGAPLQSIKQKVNRMAFQSLEFMDIEDFGGEKQIITVENLIR